jgi:hypothetical protein
MKTSNYNVAVKNATQDLIDESEYLDEGYFAVED